MVPEAAAFAGPVASTASLIDAVTFSKLSQQEHLDVRSARWPRFVTAIRFFAVNTRIASISWFTDLPQLLVSCSNGYKVSTWLLMVKPVPLVAWRLRQQELMGHYRSTVLSSALPFR